MAKDSEAQVEERRSRVGLVVGVIALAALLLFIFQNTDDAKVNFLWLDGEMPLFLLIFITVALTLVVAVIAAWLFNRRDKRR